MGELTTQDALLLAAPRLCPEIRLFRRNVGAARALHGGQVVRYGIKGQCDLVGYVRGGRVIEIELKAKGGRLSAEQKVWAEFCHSWGVPHVVLWPLAGESVDQTVARWCAELLAVSTKGDEAMREMFHPLLPKNDAGA